MLHAYRTGTTPLGPDWHATITATTEVWRSPPCPAEHAAELAFVTELRRWRSRAQALGGSA